MRQFSGLAKVDLVCFYVANCSGISAICRPDLAIQVEVAA